MDKIVIQGGAQLSGEVNVSGAKNSALPLMFATLLCEGRHTLRNVPQLKDIDSTATLLEHLGCKVARIDGRTVSIDVPARVLSNAPYEIVRKMRASVLCLGPLLARYGEAQASLPGGCAIGTRPIDQHLDGFKNLGAEVELTEGIVNVRAKSLVGSRIVFDGVTVGGTENVLMASVYASGETIIENAAKEPEIVDLADFLNKMGARIIGAGTSIIRVQGVTKLYPAEHTVIPDRIEASTLIIAGAISKGHVVVKNCVPDHFDALTSKLKECGFKIQSDNQTVEIQALKEWRSSDITTAPFPGFATDCQAQFMALMTQAIGTSVISETIFENRFMHVPELSRLGADITPRSRVARNSRQTKRSPGNGYRS